MSTVKNLIHELSAEWMDADKPVYVSFQDSDGSLRIYEAVGAGSRAQGQSLLLQEVGRW